MASIRFSTLLIALRSVNAYFTNWTEKFLRTLTQLAKRLMEPSMPKDVSSYRLIILEHI